jgi:hypothetical protein
MEHLIALPSFDVFAYLMVGITAIAMYDLYIGTGLFFRNEWTVSVGTVFVIAAYVLGHVISTASTLAIELPVIDGWAKRPEFNLLVTQDAAEKAHTQTARVLLGPYFDPLDDTTQAKIKERPYKSIGELFWQAYDIAKRDEHAFERINTFHQLYIFCRNMMFVFLLAAIAVKVRGNRRRTAVSEIEGLPPWLGNPHWQAVVLLVVSFVLFTRYLYFFRAHSIEILTSYAYAYDGAG